MTTQHTPGPTSVTLTIGEHAEMLDELDRVAAQRGVLLAALRRIERNTRGFDCDSARGIDNEIARAAIAKAEGK